MNRSPVNDVVLAVTGFLLFFGLGLVGLLILFLSARRSRSKSAVVVWGIVASGLMVLECFLLASLAGIASATSTSQHGYRILSVVAPIFVLSVIIYFPMAFILLKRRQGRS